VRRLVRAGGPLAALSISLCIGLVGVPSASGTPGHGDHAAGHAFPSKKQVDSARTQAAHKAGQVRVIKARLASANQQLQAAELAAEEASEAYNGAMWRLSEAKHRYRAAHAEAVRARRTVRTQRARIGELVAQSYQNGGDLTALNAMMSAQGPVGVLDQYAGFQGASTSLEADYKRFAAAESLARVFQAKAKAAKTEHQKLALVARQARERAVGAAESAQAETDSIATLKNQLVRQLARAQHISVSLARQRQSALEEIARKRAEERARRAALAAARANALAEARAAAAAAQRRAAAHQSSGSSGSSGSGGSGSSGGGVTPAPAPAPSPSPPPVSGGGAAQAIRFAKAQLGEPYQWGAAGPSSWDCSGLTMEAWASAGRYLPHYSVAQYESGTPIPVSDAKPGDLYFWSSNGAPSGIHHVALAIGGGQFIEAPHTGAFVRYDSIYEWYPNFAVRL
jgi:cell wall-associated NlpC family hydrolase